MINKKLIVEVYDRDGRQFLPAFRNLRFAKAFQGGEDLWLSFDLDRDININYPDVAYGHDVILRRGLDALWKGEMRAIDQGEEMITVNCLGQWVHLDDVNHGGQGRLWCESRYKMWNEITPYHASTYQQGKYSFSTANHLFIAPKKGENFLNVGYYGGLQYYCDYDEIERVSFDYDLLDPNNWQLEFLVTSGTPWNWGVETVYWTASATGTGIKDIALPAGPQGRQHLVFRLFYNAGVAQYTGETGVNCYAEISNLRLWGQTTESPSIIHVAEAVIDENTELDSSHDLAQEQLFVRDTFTDANGTLLANHQPDVNKERGPWVIDLGGYDIQGNQANNTVNWSRAVADSGVSDGVVSLDVTTPAGTFSEGLIFRRVDANNYWAWRITNAGNAELFRVIAAAGVTVWSGALGVEVGYTYHLMVKLRADEIECYLGGILRHARNDTTHQTATFHGLYSGAQVGIRSDNFEIYQAHPIWPLFYEKGESGYGAIKDCSSFGDWNYKPVGWGVESGGDRMFIKQADRQSVRYVIPPQYLAQATSRGDTQREFYTSAWAKYKDEQGIWRWTDKHYVHVTNTGLEVNTTSTGDDLASVIYGVDRDHTIDFGRVDENVAVAYLIQWLMEHGHPQVKSSYRVYGPVQDLGRGGAWIDPAEMEVGHVVQIPFFRAVEAEGVVGSDLRDYDTTFFLVGLEHNDERGITTLIPEGATEDLQRIIAYARAFQKKEEREHITKRSEVIGG